jgi:endonuclease/exonuclease/phosphatase family metal-dependent hydrolase
MLTMYFSPAEIHILTFLGFLFPALWLINLIFLIIHALRRSKRLFIPLLVLALTFNQWTNNFQLSGTDGPSQVNQPVKIMTYNSRMFDFYNWSGLPNTPDAIFDFIKKEDPDILCIQEYFTSERKEAFYPSHIVARLRNLRFRHIEYSHNNKRGTGYGIATFSKFPVINKGSLPFDSSQNMSIFTDINVSGSIVRVFNNHLESIGFKEHDYNLIESLKFEMDKKQRQGIQQIAQKMTRAFKQRSNQAEILSRHINNSPHPVIVCGDFNDTPTSYVYRKMRGDLKDAFRESGSGLGSTYNGRLPSLRIDYIFHENEFKSYRFKRHKIDYSDHFPISTLLELNPAPNK